MHIHNVQYTSKIAYPSASVSQEACGDLSHPATVFKAAKLESVRSVRKVSLVTGINFAGRFDLSPSFAQK